MFIALPGCIVGIIAFAFIDFAPPVMPRPVTYLPQTSVAAAPAARSPIIFHRPTTYVVTAPKAKFENCVITRLSVEGRSGTPSRVLYADYTINNHQVGFHAKLSVLVVTPKTIQRGRQTLSVPIEIPPGPDPFSGVTLMDVPEDAVSLFVSIRDAQSGLALSAYTIVNLAD